VRATRPGQGTAAREVGSAQEDGAPGVAVPAATPGAPRRSSRGATTARPVGARVRRAQGSPWPWLVGIGGIAALIGVTVAMNAMREAGMPGERFPSQGNVHVALGTDTPPYNTDPPTSGWHTPGLAGWGAYLDEAPHDQMLLHNMEDGGVILWYAAGTPEENEEHVRALQEVLGGRWPRTVIAPREGLETPYVLTAWTRLQRFDELDPEGKRTFVAAYHGLDHHPGAR
jgi:hypothetical protein